MADPVKIKIKDKLNRTIKVVKQGYTQFAFFQKDIFNLERNTARNEAINNPIFNPTTGITTTFTLKAGITNDYATKDHTLQIKIFDTENLAVYTTQYDPANVINYSTQILVRMFKGDVQTDYSISIWDKEVEGQATNTIDIEEGAAAGSATPPPFKYEVYIIDRQPSLADTHPASGTLPTKVPVGRVVDVFGNAILQMQETAFAGVNVNDEVRVSLEPMIESIGASTIAASAMLYIGETIQIKQAIQGSAVKSNVLWETKTNPTDTNIKDNYKEQVLVLKKVSATEYDFVNWDPDPKYRYMTRTGGNFDGTGIPDGATLTLKNGKWHWIKLAHEFTRQTKAELDAIAANELFDGDIGYVIADHKFYHYHIKKDPTDAKPTGWELHVDSGGTGGSAGGTTTQFAPNVYELLNNKGAKDTGGSFKLVEVGKGFGGQIDVGKGKNTIHIGGMGFNFDNMPASGQTLLVKLEADKIQTETPELILSTIKEMDLRPDGGVNQYKIIGKTYNDVFLENTHTRERVSLDEIIKAVLYWKTNHGGGAT